MEERKIRRRKVDASSEFLTVPRVIAMRREERTEWTEQALRGMVVVTVVSSYEESLSRMVGGTRRGGGLNFEFQIEIRNRKPINMHLATIQEQKSLNNSSFD